MSTPHPAYKGSAPARTISAANRAGAAEVLLEHLHDEEQAREILDFAELEGEAQTAQARVSVDRDGTWIVDLFGPR